MFSISTPRQSPSPTRFIPEIVANRWTMAPDSLLVQSLSMVISQTVFVSSDMFGLLFSQNLRRPFRQYIAHSFPGSAPASESMTAIFYLLNAHIESAFKTQLLGLETLRPDGLSAPPTGIKRSHEFSINMDGFIQDVKKRRLVPSYDSRMRLNLCLGNNL